MDNWIQNEYTLPVSLGWNLNCPDSHNVTTSTTDLYAQGTFFVPCSATPVSGVACSCARTSLIFKSLANIEQPNYARKQLLNCQSWRLFKCVMNLIKKCRVIRHALYQNIVHSFLYYLPVLLCCCWIELWNWITIQSNRFLPNFGVNVGSCNKV